VIKDITLSVSEAKTDINRVESKLKKDGKTIVIKISVKVSGLKQLDNLTYKLKELSGIIKVRKINS